MFIVPLFKLANRSLDTATIILCTADVSAFKFMGNILCFHAFPSQLFAIDTNKNPVPSSPPENEFDVFITHRGKDVKETIASLIFHNLRNKGRRVFLDKNSIPVGLGSPESIEQAIYKSSVHIAIFSPNYAESEWCLSELCLISETGAPIIPVFYQVRPSEVRMEREDGLYARAFEMHTLSGKFTSRTLKQWKKALCDVSYTEGIIFEGDQGELLERIASCVSDCMERRKFQPKAYHEQAHILPSKLRSELCVQRCGRKGCERYSQLRPVRKGLRGRRKARG